VGTDINRRFAVAQAVPVCNGWLVTGWKRNLIVVWLSQLFSITGFMLALPFAPFYIQALGVSDPAKVRIWAAFSQFSAAFGLAVMGPIWGMLADRYGRKKMMLRANFCAAVVLSAMAAAPNVWIFIALRLMQGMFTGTMNAAMAFVASYTPHRRQGTALGTLSAAVCCGAMAGPALGGLLAETVGYRATFVGAGQLLLLSALLVLFLVREQFTGPVDRPAPEGAARASWRERVAALGPGAPILFLVFLASFARRFDGPYLALFVQELHGKLEGVSRLTGLVFTISALGAAISGPLLGWVADRSSPLRVGRVSALVAGLAMGSLGFCRSLLYVPVARFVAAFAGGGLDPVFFAWLSRLTPQERRGTIFGWSTTARSLGWGISPLVGAMIAVPLGLRAVFFAGVLWCLLLLPVMGVVSRRVAAMRATSDWPGPASEEGPRMP